LDLLEHQGKDIFRRNGLPVLEGHFASSPDEAAEAAAAIGAPAVLKAQVPVGGRGKAGGIRPAATPEEARSVASDILGMRIKGFPVRELLIEESAPEGKELYLAIILDRSIARPSVLFSTKGGIDIEEVAESHPDHVARGHFSTLIPFTEYRAKELVASLGAAHVIEFALADPARTPSDEALRGVAGVTEVRRENGAVLLGSDEPHVTVPALMALLAREPGALARLATHSATLEDVFVALTGRHLRDG